MASTSALPTNERCDPLLDRIITLWNVPPEARSELDRTHSFSRSRSLAPGEALAMLTSEFGAERLSRCVDRTLDTVAEMCLGEEVPDRRTMFLTGCLLDLVNAGDEIRIRPQTIERIVQAFPVAIWYRPVGTLVRNKMDRAELAKVLLQCLDRRPSSFLQLSCLEAIIMYMPMASADQDPAGARKGSAVLRTRLAALQEEPDPDLKKTAARAAEALRALEQGAA